jgi:hypothetical protein
VSRLEVTALADQLASHLASGAFATVGAVDLGPEGRLESAELAARVVLADVDHWAYVDRARHPRVPNARWDHLAEQLKRLLGYAGAS